MKSLCHLVVLVVVAGLATVMSGSPVHAQEETPQTSKLAPGNVDFKVEAWGITPLWRQSVAQRYDKELRAVHHTGKYVVLECKDNTLYVLTAASGAVRCGTVLRQALEHNPTEYGENQLMIVVGGVIYALDADTGKVGDGWRMEVSAFTRPHVVDETIIASDATDRVAGADINEKSPVWSVRCGGPVMNRPALDGSTLFVVGFRGRALALDAESGARKWDWTPPKPNALSTGAVVVDDTVYVADLQGTVYALDKENGTVEWRQIAELGMKGQPAAGAGKVLFLNSKPEMIAMDPEADDKVAWKLKGVTRIVTVGKERAYVMDKDNTMLAVSLADGTVEWTDPLGPDIHVSSAADGGFVVSDTAGMVVSFGEIE